MTDIKGEKKIIPVPPNQETVNTLFNENISSVQEMETWLSSRRPNLKGKLPSNGEEMSLSRVGTELYEKVGIILFRNIGLKSEALIRPEGIYLRSILLRVLLDLIDQILKRTDRYLSITQRNNGTSTQKSWTHPCLRGFL